ncbi:uncharacterized protein LOC129578607 [Sitodiplosis mosellana]|uniref:uncharacterized protein LOC129578607 n=1 Tax=Sitodiplosis mosellana TaxID=263140 RepID=UPI002444720F|nr:uncharacterized protein LOC129578607 [Sitodiplosis mosellana]
MFGGHFFVDERPINLLKKPSIYVFSRPFNLRSVKPRDTRRIYTTALLKASMRCTENIRESIEVINDNGEPYNIELSNGETVCVRAFQWGSKTLNVIFLFEHKKNFTLYAGRFTSSGDIVQHNLLPCLMRENRIDELYVDITAYNITEFNLKRKACREIQELLSDSDHKKFHMLIDNFGYEDLIFELVKNEVKIYLDPEYSTEIFKWQQCLDQFCTDQAEADIILVNKLAEDTEKQFREDNIISIKLTTDSRATDSDHLRIVKYTFYPTQADIFHTVFLASPVGINPINQTDTIPLELCELCR